MRILILSDIHSNVVALEAVLAAVGSFDDLWCLGDTIGYGPRPNECIEHMRALAKITITGNHDLASLEKIDLSDFNPAARAANLWNGEQLSAENRAWLEPLPPAQRIDDQFMVAHGSPREPVWEYVLMPDQARNNFESFEVFDTQICFIGHSHVQLGFRYDPQTRRCDRFLPTPGTVVDLAEPTRFLLNPGSIGQPRDQNPLAAYGLLDTEAGTFTFERVEYDISETQRQMEAAGLPQNLIARLAFGM